MPRLSISFTEPNDEWLKSQVDSKEYSSKSEVINEILRSARKQQKEVDWIRMKLEKAEKSGFSNSTREEILKKSKETFNAQI